MEDGRSSGAVYLFAAIFTALGTVFAAYAAWKATESAERIAGLQAVAQFNGIVNSNSRAGACIAMLEANHDLVAEEALLAKEKFTIKAIKLGETARCLQKSEQTLTLTEEIAVSPEQSNEIFQQIFNYLNGSNLCRSLPRIH